jgi:hypothetical protein
MFHGMDRIAIAEPASSLALKPSAIDGGARLVVSGALSPVAGRRAVGGRVVTVPSEAAGAAWGLRQRVLTVTVHPYSCSLAVPSAGNQGPREVKEMSKPTARLIGADGNVFNLIGIAARVLKEDGQLEEAKEMTARCFAAQSYDEALSIISGYVEIR